VHLIRRAARSTTADNPVLTFPQVDAATNGIGRRVTERLASVTITENGRSRRVPLMREDDYRATYAPLISLISERCTNDDSLDLALGRPMDEFRFVIALTFEQLNSRRARHLRAMVMWEKALLELSEEMPRVEAEEHKTRYRTLLAIAKQYRAHPERFGIVKVWRPKLAAGEAQIQLVGRSRTSHQQGSTLTAT
jgi:hypothetical protein